VTQFCRGIGHKKQYGASDTVTDKTGIGGAETYINEYGASDKVPLVLMGLIYI